MSRHPATKRVARLPGYTWQDICMRPGLGLLIGGDQLNPSSSDFCLVLFCAIHGGLELFSLGCFLSEWLRDLYGSFV